MKVAVTASIINNSTKEGGGAPALTESTPRHPRFPVIDTSISLGINSLCYKVEACHMGNMVVYIYTDASTGSPLHGPSSKPLFLAHILTSDGRPTSKTLFPFLNSLSDGILLRLINSALWLMTGSICMLATATTVSPFP